MDRRALSDPQRLAPCKEGAQPAQYWAGSEEVAAPGTGQGCGTTVDWLIIGHARAEGCVLVSDDMGPEFTGLIKRVKLGTLEAALLKLVSASS